MDVRIVGFGPVETETVEHRTGVSVVAFDDDRFLSVRHVLVRQHCRECVRFRRVLAGSQNCLLELLRLHKSDGRSHLLEQHQDVA